MSQLPWTLDAPPPDVRRLNDAELLRVWRQNRSGVPGANTALGAVAADECARRLEQRQEER